MNYLLIQLFIREGGQLICLVLDQYEMGSASLGNSRFHEGSQGNFEHDHREKKLLVKQEKVLISTIPIS